MFRSLAITVFFLAAWTVQAAGPNCSKVQTLSENAAFYRDQGLTQEQLRYPLPSRDYFAGDPDNPKNAELQLMHQIVDELYLAPELPSDLYVTFKAEQCRLLAVSPTNVRNFAQAAGELSACVPLKGSERKTCAVKSANGPVGNGP